MRRHTSPEHEPGCANQTLFFPQWVHSNERALRRCHNLVDCATLAGMFDIEKQSRAEGRWEGQDRETHRGGRGGQVRLAVNPGCNSRGSSERYRPPRPRRTHRSSERPEGGASTLRHVQQGVVGSPYGPPHINAKPGGAQAVWGNRFTPLDTRIWHRFKVFVRCHLFWFSRQP